MGKLKVVLNRDGVRELLRSDEMMAICEEYASAAVGRLGEGYIMTSQTGKNRVNASVYAETPNARKENAKNNTILKAVRGK